MQKITPFIEVLIPLLISISFIGCNDEKNKCSGSGCEVLSIIEKDLVLVKGGTFLMGCSVPKPNECADDEIPAHNVTLSDYYISKFEVTQSLWRKVMGTNPSSLYHKDCDNCPVEMVSWNQIEDFLLLLNSMTGKEYRLPTEAEWEFAARGGNKSKGYKYSGSNTPDKVAWFDDSSGNTHPVGEKNPNELGLFDMSGNVWEWCQDWHGKYSADSKTNPVGPSTGSLLVVRGGGWSSKSKYCRVLNRGKAAINDRFIHLGFRLVRK